MSEDLDGSKGSYVFDVDGLSRSNRQCGIYEVNKLFDNYLIEFSKKINGLTVMSIYDYSSNEIPKDISIAIDDTDNLIKFLRASADFLEERLAKEQALIAELLPTKPQK
jgi:hypothetical protein